MKSSGMHHSYSKDVKFLAADCGIQAWERNQLPTTYHQLFSFTGVICFEGRYGRKNDL